MAGKEVLVNLLLPIDPFHPLNDEAVLNLAVHMAATSHAEVHLLAVTPADGRGTFEPPDPARSALRGYGSVGKISAAGRWDLAGPAGVALETRDQAIARQRWAIRDRLAAHAARFGDLPVRIEVMLADQPSPAIARYAEEQRIDLIVMGTHARGSVGRLLLGSVAEDVVHRAAAPVLLVGPHCRLGHGEALTTLIASIDSSGLSEAIVPAAAFWARALGLHVTLVTVISPDAGDALLRGYAQVEQLSKSLNEQGIAADWEVLHGKDPARAISRYAADVPGSIMALITYARTDGARDALGSAAVELVHESPVPVLVMHPPTEGNLAPVGAIQAASVRPAAPTAASRAGPQAGSEGLATDEWDDEHIVW